VWEASKKKVKFLSKYSLDRNNTIDSLFPTQYTPDFLIAEYYDLRNTFFWGSKDLGSGVRKEPEPRPRIRNNHILDNCLPNQHIVSPEGKKPKGYGTGTGTLLVTKNKVFRFNTKSQH
jgi:hypothetical protein